MTDFPIGQLIEDVPDHIYHADPFDVPTLNAGTGRLLVDKSPAHAYASHPRLGGNPGKHSKQFDFGKHGHKLLLAKGSPLAPVYIENSGKKKPTRWASRFDDEWCIFTNSGRLRATAPLATGEAVMTLGFRPADSWRTTAAKSAQGHLRAMGRIPVLKRDELDMMGYVRVWRERLLKHRDRYGKLDPISFDGITEGVLSWHSSLDSGDTVTCRAKLDHFKVFSQGGRNYAATIDDVKTCKDAHPSMCYRKIFSLGSHIQRTAYREGVSKVFDVPLQHVRFRWVFVEISNVSAVTVIESDESASHLGESDWTRAKGIWHRCNASGEWPDYSGRTHMVSAPAWKMRELEEREYESETS